MNRRKFLYSTALGLFVPSVFGIPPLRIRTIQRPKKATITPSEVSLKFSSGASDDSQGSFGRDDTNDSYGRGGNFTAPSTFSVSYIYVWLYRSGTATTTCRAVFHANDTASPGSELTNGESTNTVTLSTLDVAPAQQKQFNFTGLTLTSGTVYWLVLWASAIEAANYFNVRFQTTGTQAVKYSTAARATPSWSTSDSSAEIKLQIYGT